MKNVIDTDYKFFSCTHGPKIKVFCPKDLLNRQDERSTEKKVKSIKPLCSRNCARLVLIIRPFFLIHLPKKPLDTFFFSDLDSIWCNVIYCMLYLTMVITVGFVFYSEVTML